jgi:hypothetical protein
MEVIAVYFDSYMQLVNKARGISADFFDIEGAPNFKIFNE